MGQIPSVAQTSELMIIGWLIELLNAAYCIWDDIEDGSSTRRGQPCWYTRPDVGMMAINDACYLESAVYHILKKHFREHPAYIDLVELFLEVGLRTKLGQAYDLLASSRHFKLHQFGLDKYEFMATHKTAYYTTYLPLASSLFYLQLATPKNLEEVRKIAMLMGLYFQAQDDFLDVFGNPAITGKVGTDIQKNKYTWLVAEALRRCSEGQRQVLDMSYGRDDEEHASKVKEIFKQLDMVEEYENWEKKMVVSIKSAIDGIDESAGLKKEVFTTLLSKILSDPRKQLPQC
ncbi:hypothetical protein V502_02935 [Pseudogymnoascus sp. VKM F-4520 (FW-2644)]|nr:hypothetical protein V502_02935 [Pseudogymnoascus sp. VKM F-4520 (FW-2644)]